jgi:hypothetical protein
MDQESITPVLNKYAKRTEPECRDTVDVAKGAKKEAICEEYSQGHSFRLDNVRISIDVIPLLLREREQKEKCSEQL